MVDIQHSLQVSIDIKLIMSSFNRSFVPSGLRKHLGAVIDMAEEEKEREGEEEEEKKGAEERESLIEQLKTCHQRLKGLSNSAE